MAVNINIPSQVRTFANLAAFPASGSLKTIYIAEDTNKTYRWDGSTYVEISASAATGLTVGTTPIASGTIGRVLFQGTGNVLQQSSSLFWDGTNNRLGIGTSSPFGSFDVRDGDIFATISSNANLRSRLTYQGLYVSRVTDGTYPERIISTAGFWEYHSRNAHVFYRDGSPLMQLGTTGLAAFISLNTTGNFLIGTSTDAGFRLDVNGTARVSGNSFFATGTATGGNGVGIGTTSLGTIDVNQRVVILNAGLYPGYILGTNTGSTKAFFSINGFNNNASIGTETNSALLFWSANAERMRIFGSTGNVGINTTTDAGFRLDVNGTARVNNDLTIGSNRYLKAFRWTQDDVTRSLQLESNSNFNVDSVNVISLNNSLLNNTKNLINIGLSSTVGTQSSGSTDAFNVLNIIPTYNMPFGTHTIKGIYYNPTLTAMVGTTHHAFHSTSGRIRFENLPTSATGLSAGDLWNDGGTLKIV
jgi:hypothetical protein